MALIDLFSSHGFIPVSKLLFAKYDLPCAVLICELSNQYVFNKSRGKLINEYFYSTVDNIEKNTSLTARQQRRCMDILASDGLIECKLMGIPAKRFVKINTERLLQIVEECEATYNAPEDIPDGTIDPSLLCGNVTDSCYILSQQAVTKGNIIYSNNNSNNKYNKDILSGKPDGDLTKIKEIVEYLNQKTGKSFKYNTQKTQSCIKARLKEGFSADDFKTVINLKTEQWGKDPKMSVYLRPETLFGTKFEGYLNEAPKKKEARSVMTEQERAVAEAKWAKEHGFGYDPKILGEE